MTRRRSRRGWPTALAGGDVASLIITAPAADPAAFQRAAEALVPIAAARGVAALIHNDTRIAGRASADGVHIDGGVDDVDAALQTLARQRKIVGAGGLAHPPRGDGDRRHRSRLPVLRPPRRRRDRRDLPQGARPCRVVVGGDGRSRRSSWAAERSPRCDEAAVDTASPSSRFAAAVWDDPRGPAAAVAEACDAARRARRPVA